MLTRPVLAGLLLLVLGQPGCAPPSSGPPGDFAGLVSALSEPGGYFDTDNLVSNESAYLHVMDRLEELEGGAYLGVGPEQNFSYIAEIEPAVAVVIDIRRDNMLLLLLFKALFEDSETRIEYLARLFGRPVPANPGSWSARSLEEHLAYIDSLPPASSPVAGGDPMATVIGFGIPLTTQDTTTIRRFHAEFIERGLGLAFSTFGRPAQRRYPTVRRLYLETDLAGQQRSYLATETRWRTVRDLQRADRVLPVVGDLSGTTAMPAIARYFRSRNLTVSAIYASNVEFYLLRSGGFANWVENVRGLPTDSRSLIIRSWFDQGLGGPGIRPGHFSSQHAQGVEGFLALVAEPASLTYRELVSDER